MAVTQEILVDSIEGSFRGSVHVLSGVIPRDEPLNFPLKLLAARLRLNCRPNRDFLEQLIVDSVVVEQHADQFVALHVTRDLGFHVSEDGVVDGEKAVAIAERGERMIGEEDASHLKEKKAADEETSTKRN